VAGQIPRNWLPPLPGSIPPSGRSTFRLSLVLRGKLDFFFFLDPTRPILPHSRKRGLSFGFPGIESDPLLLYIIRCFLPPGMLPYRLSPSPFLYYVRRIHESFFLSTLAHPFHCSFAAVLAPKTVAPFLFFCGQQSTSFPPLRRPLFPRVIPDSRRVPEWRWTLLWYNKLTHPFKPPQVWKTINGESPLSPPSFFFNFFFP